LEPKNARIYVNRGAIKLRQRKVDDAHKDFKIALQLDPGLKARVDPLMAVEAAPNSK